MVKITVVFCDKFHELEVDPADGAEILKIQVTSLTDVSPDKMLISGIGSGFLHDLADISSLKDGQLLTVTEGDASAIPQQWTESAAEAPTAKTGAPASIDKIYGFLPSDVQLLTPNGGTTTAGTLTGSKVLGLYFSAHWCPPCRGFTPKLAEAYRNIKSAGKAFEIVFVSSDKSERQFADYFREMPWLAMPYALRDLKTGLSQMFGVTGIPALILLDGATGDLISKDGRNVLMSDPQGAEFPWSSSSGTAPAVNPFATAAAAGSSRGRAAGGITLADLQKALNPKSAQEEARARQEHERQRSMDDMQNRIMGGAQHVLVYEDKAVQAQALAKIPVEDIEQKALDSPGDLAPRDAIARHLLGWFKGYFAWVNNAPCEHCGSAKTSGAGGDKPNAIEKGFGAGAVELYTCADCAKTTRFPRYNHPGKLMETRKGRCGEWANAFTLCCIAMGFEARHTVDWTDHVWTEVYSDDQQRWIHCDACENSWDAPLLYSEGWGKKLTYVVAFSKEEVVDVTCRYTRQWDQCVARRDKCPELWLAEFVASLRMSKLASLPPARRTLLVERAEKEKKELEPRNYVKPADPPAAAAAAAEGGAGDESVQALPGRTTGSLEWRAARGEIGNLPVVSKPPPAAASAAVVGNNELTQSGMHGRTHDDSRAFDDAAQKEGAYWQQLRVRAVTVWAGEGEGALVHGVQLHYVRTQGEATSLVDGVRHLAASEGCPAPRKIILKEGEAITQLGGRAGAVVDRLDITIQTCTGDVCSQRVEVFGGIGGSAFSCPVPEGQVLVGLAGGLGGHLHSISFYTYPRMQGSSSGAPGAAVEVGRDLCGTKTGCATTTLLAESSAPANAPSPDQDKVRLQKLIRHFFFEIQKEGGAGAGDANAAAAKAVDRARQWLAANGSLAPLPVST